MTPIQPEDLAPPLRIMLVEDDLVMASLFRDVLEELGHDICAIESTQREAVTTAARLKPDLMIVDATLRQGGGVEAMDEIELTGLMPHFFVTADGLGIQLRRPAALVLQKPVQQQDLADAIEQILGIKGGRAI